MDLASEVQLDQIEEAAETILEDVGIEFRGDENVLGMWKAAGALVEGERVQFPRGMIRELCRTAPSEFTQHARHAENSVKIGGRCTVFAPAYGSPFVRDSEGGRRYGSIADFENLVKLAHSSPNLHHSGGTVCEPVDIAVNKRHLDMVYAHLRYSDRPIMGSVTTADRALDSIDMCRVVFGRDFVDDNCVILGNVNVNSPLVYDGEVVRVITTYADANQGVVIVPFILGGAMGPVTTAGAIAQAHAETMVGVALTQLVRPGAPLGLVRQLVAFYIWFIRGTPALIQIFIVYFGLPQLGLKLNPFTAGVLALGLGSAAYVAEIIRSGLKAIPEGQFDGARALGLNTRLLYHRVVLPQVVRIVVPSLTNEAINTLKNTSLLSAITVLELTLHTQTMIAATFRPFEFYTLAALLYLLMTTVLSQFASWYERAYPSYT